MCFADVWRKQNPLGRGGFQVMDIDIIKSYLQEMFKKKKILTLDENFAFE